jgi:signal transduction histidine kinase
MGMVDHLLETKIAPEQKEMLDTINSCGNSLTTILNDILDLSKVESGKMDLEHIPVNMPQFVEEVRFLFQPKAHQKQIDYNVTLTGDELPRFFFGDVTRLKQIVINLLSNAFKFTDKGEAR